MSCHSHLGTNPPRHRTPRKFPAYQPKTTSTSPPQISTSHHQYPHNASRSLTSSNLLALKSNITSALNKPPVYPFLLLPSLSDYTILTWLHHHHHHICNNLPILSTHQRFVLVRHCCLNVGEWDGICGLFFVFFFAKRESCPLSLFFSFLRRSID